MNTMKIKENTQEPTMATVICLRIGKEVIGWDWLNNKLASELNLPLGKELVLSLRNIPQFIQENYNAFEIASKVTIPLGVEEEVIDCNHWYHELRQELQKYYDTYYPGRSCEPQYLEAESGLGRWGVIKPAQPFVELMDTSNLPEDTIPALSLIIQHVVKPVSEIENPTHSDWLSYDTYCNWAYNNGTREEAIAKLHHLWSEGKWPRFWRGGDLTK